MTMTTMADDDDDDDDDDECAMGFGLQRGKNSTTTGQRDVCIMQKAGRAGCQTKLCVCVAV